MVQKKKIKIFTQNVLMSNGNKWSSEKVTRDILKEVQKTTKKDYKLVYMLAIKNANNILSNIEIKRRKNIFYIPFFNKKKKRIFNTIRLICLQKTNKRKINIISEEIIKLSRNKKSRTKVSISVINSTSFINKHFANYRWFY